MFAGSRKTMGSAKLGGSADPPPGKGLRHQAPWGERPARSGSRRNPPVASAAIDIKEVLAMRKISLVLLGATAGAALALLATQPRLAVIGSAANAAAMQDIYRQLGLFGDVFERVRADYVEKPDDNKLIQNAIN